MTLLVFQECMADVKSCRKSPSPPSARTRSTSKCLRAGKRNEASPSGPQPGSRQDWISRTSLRRLQVSHSTELTPAGKDKVNFLTACVAVQAKMEAENQQAKEIIQPLLDTENGFVKVICWTLCHLWFA